MDASTIYQKTAQGEQEIKTRAAKLPQQMRTMLILTDGTKPLGELRGVAQRLGIKEDFVATLEGKGLIAPLGGRTAQAAPAAPQDEFARFTAARRFMNDTVVDAMGIRSFLFTLKIEKCGTRAELSFLLDDYTRLIKKGSGEAQAAVFTERARELLA